MNEPEEYFLAKIASNDIKYEFIEEDPSDILDDLIKNVPYFKSKIEENGTEIFKINGRQFMTEDGLYLIVRGS